MDADSLLLFIFFLLCSAYCASAETAYTAVSRVRLRTMVDKGNKKAGVNPCRSGKLACL